MKIKKIIIIYFKFEIIQPDEYFNNILENENI